MAAAMKRCLRWNNFRFLIQRRQLTTTNTTPRRFAISTLCGSVVGVSVGAYFLNEARKNALRPALAKEAENVDKSAARRAAIQTARELRFLSFASLEYDGNIYMTPQDFLESVTEEVPRARTGRRRLHEEEVRRYLRSTPSRWKGSSNFFTQIDDKGLISYTEYLFLLCVLTKPHSGFRIAFNMFDTDGNQRVDKQEFLVLQTAILKASSSSPGVVEGAPEKQLVDCVGETLTSGRVAATAAVHQPPATRHRINIWDSLRPAEGEERSPPTDTTLTVHFFGAKGYDVLKYEDFHRFMDNLQTEVLRLEFHEFSRGMASITEEEFARVLLRYTILTGDETEEYLTRLRERIPHVQGISFDDFKDFGQFLNNLDDFAIAMRLYTFNGKPINEEEFKRAVKAVTGHSLHPHLVHVVFQLFDSDGDGHLSHKEFISVMKDRLHRGFRSQTMHELGKWDVYKACIKHEMKHG